jgi:hypothetical protein
VSLTPEARAKAQAGREAAKARAAHFKREWADSGLWDELAKAKGTRLPLWSKATTPRFLKRWHESLDTEPFEAVYGCSPSRLISLNPHTPLRAFVGMMLERAK